MRVLALLLLAFTACAVAVQLDCQSLGFTGLSLCSDCRELESFVKDEELVGECLRCCAEESTEEGARFSSAVLEVCPHTLRSYPHIETFVEKKAAQYSNLKVRMKYGAAPRLLLKNKGSPAVSVRIDQWKTEHIEQYLEEKLEGPSAQT